jgi:hypothetical protein
LVAVLQVDEVGGGDPREMVDFGGAFAAEMQCWVPEKWVYDERSKSTAKSACHSDTPTAR